MNSNDKTSVESPMPSETAERGPGSLQRMVRPLRLHLKGCYFDAIRDGTKTHEYRLADKWEKRLSGKTYDEIHLLRGYPKRGDESRLLRRVWRGYKIAWLTHPHFDSVNVRVLAIDVTARPNDPSSATRPTRALDCNLDAMAGFAAAHG